MMYSKRIKLDPQASSADVLAAVVFKSQVVLAGQRHEGDCGKHTGRNYEQGFLAIMGHGDFEVLSMSYDGRTPPSIEIEFMQL